LDLKVGIVTNIYPSERSRNMGTFVEDLVKQLRSGGVSVRVIKHERNFPAMSFECLINSTRVDVLDAQFVAPAGVVTALTPRFCPYVVTAHRWDIFEFPYKCRLARIATLTTLRRASGIIAVGSAVRSQILRFVPSNSVLTTIPNAVDNRRFRPDIESCFLKRQLGIPDSHRVILAVGELVPRKGFVFLLKAMADVVKQFQQCTLVIVGGGSQQQELVNLGQRLCLTDRLRLPGVVEESLLPMFYALADIFVMPSLSEGHCVAILEAMSAGKPIVASAIPGNAASVVEGENGLLVPPADPKSMANAIICLLRDDSLRESYGRRSREKAVTEFGWQLRIQRLKEFYLRVLA
jgi:glycosyltransferase involved in cell wall biosynthesis